MARNRIIYPNQQMFVGPAPATGYHFVDIWGNVNNNYQSSLNNNNLLFAIDRVQSVSWEINQPYSTVKMVGQIGELTDTASSIGRSARPKILSPTINLNFDYLPIGVRNEARLGMLVNYSQYQGGLNGNPYYQLRYQEYGLPLISGFYDKTLIKNSGESWPYKYRDGRNFYLAVAGEGVDAIQGADMQNFTGLNDGLFHNPRAKDLQVFGFGNCYLNSYSLNFTVGQLPVASVSYVCENLNFVSGGSGKSIVGLEPRSGRVNDAKFTLPQVYETSSPSVLLPGDVTLTIGDQNEDNIIFGYNYSEIRASRYSVSFNFQRSELRGLGYKYPIDRPVNFPVMAQISVDAIIGDLYTGAINELYKNDYDYNITVKVKEPAARGVSSYSGYFNGTFEIQQPGMWSGERRTSLLHTIRGAKFDSATYNSSIGTNSTVTLNYSVPLSPDNFKYGLFISGLMHIEELENYFVDITGSQGNYFSLFSGDILASDFIPLY